MNKFVVEFKNLCHTMFNELGKALYQIHNGAAVDKFAGTAKISIFSSPIAYLCSVLTDWFSLNSGYVIFVFIAIIIDHLVGSWVHAFIKRDFSMKKNIKGFFTKTIMVILVGIIVEGMVYLLGSRLFISDYFGFISKIMVFIYPAGSALMNVSIITNGVFPPTVWLDKIKKFNRDADLRHFKPKKDDKL